MRSQGRAFVSEVLPGPGGTVDTDKERVRHPIDNTGLLSQPSFGNDDQFFWGRTVADVGAASVPQVRRYLATDDAGSGDRGLNPVPAGSLPRGAREVRGASDFRPTGDDNARPVRTVLGTVRCMGRARTQGHAHDEQEDRGGVDSPRLIYAARSSKVYGTLHRKLRIIWLTNRHVSSMQRSWCTSAGGIATLTSAQAGDDASIAGIATRVEITIPIDSRISLAFMFSPSEVLREDMREDVISFLRKNLPSSVQASGQTDSPSKLSNRVVLSRSAPEKARPVRRLADGCGGLTILVRRPSSWRQRVRPNYRHTTSPRFSGRTDLRFS